MTFTQHRELGEYLVDILSDLLILTNMSAYAEILEHCHSFEHGATLCDLAHARLDDPVG